jgi:hypothetical protein
MDIILKCERDDLNFEKVLEKISDIQSDNGWCEIVIVFKDGKVDYWSDKNTHK